MPKKIYEGTCAACKREGECKRDRRVSRSLGGDFSADRNLQDLCLSCYSRKVHLENNLFSFYGSGELIEEWFHLSFQNDQQLIQLFLNELSAKLNHFQEVFRNKFKT